MQFSCSPPLSVSLLTPTGTRHRFWLGKSEIEKGLSLMAEAYSKHFSDFIEENDDADTADTFLQLCLFGEVVFG
jgi:hypothetical protein